MFLNWLRFLLLVPSMVVVGSDFHVGCVWSEPYVANSNLTSSVHVSIFEMIAEISGIRMIFHFEDDLNQEFAKHGTFELAKNALVDGRLHAVIGRIYFNITGYDDDIIHGPNFFDDEFVYIVRKPRKLKVFRNVFRGFSNELWATIALIFGAVSIVYGIFARILDNIQIVDSIFAIIAIYLNASIGRGGNVKRWAFKLFLLSVMLYSLNLTTIYLGVLSDIYTESATEPKIYDLEQLYLNSINLTITMYHEQILRFRYYVSPSAKFSRLVNVAEVRDAELIKKVAQTQEGAAGAFISTFYSMLAEEQVLDYFFITQFTLTPMHSTFWLKRNHHQVTIIEFWANEIIEKGFTVKFWRDYTSRNFNHTLMRSALTKEPRQPHGLLHYEETFHILLIGQLVSILVFFLEFAAQKLELQISWMEDNSRF